jgi:UDP-N-acetyl-D-mannosaminuronic acid transferase (WecB/TagA/CpsF family)
MPNKTLATRRPPQPARQAWASLAAQGVVSLATAAAGIYCLWTHSRIIDAERVLAPAGIALLASFLAQARIAIAGWQNRGALADQNPLGQFRFWRWMLTGAFFVYLAALAAGPRPNLGWAWLSAVAVGYALLLLPLAVSPRVLDGWRQLSRGHATRRLGWLVYVSIGLLICCEAGLRAERFAVRHGWLAESNQWARTGGLAPGTSPAEFQHPDVRLAEFRPDPFRVAILGHDAVLGSAGPGGYLARVQQLLPGLDIVPLPAGPAWSNSSASDLSAQLAACRPDLVLVAMSLCEDLAHPRVSPSWFDWKQFELAQWISGANRRPEREADGVPGVAARDDFESFLRVLAPQLAACRTPIDEAMRARWQQTFASLDELLTACRARQVSMAWVLVPSEIQVNRALCATLARRTGSAADQYDVDLPHRRLADFAQQRDVPVLDLLPYLRLSQQSLYERNATVWNEQGQAAVAAAMGRWLESRYAPEPALAARLSRTP